MPVLLATPAKAFCDWLYGRGLVDRWPADRLASMLEDMNRDELLPDAVAGAMDRFFPTQALRLRQLLPPDLR